MGREFLPGQDVSNVGAELSTESQRGVQQEGIEARTGREGTLFDDPGGHCFTTLHPERTKNRALHQLQDMGYRHLEPGPVPPQPRRESSRQRAAGKHWMRRRREEARASSTEGRQIPFWDSRGILDG